MIGIGGAGIDEPMWRTSVFEPGDDQPLAVYAYAFTVNHRGLCEEGGSRVRIEESTDGHEWKTVYETAAEEKTGTGVLYLGDLVTVHGDQGPGCCRFPSAIVKALHATTVDIEITEQCMLPGGQPYRNVSYSQLRKTASRTGLDITFEEPRPPMSMAIYAEQIGVAEPITAHMELVPVDGCDVRPALQPDDAVCIKPKGHDGAHKDKDGCWWGPYCPDCGQTTEVLVICENDFHRGRAGAL